MANLTVLLFDDYSTTYSTANSINMSLEQKFASLSIDDTSSIVDTVKSEGVEKSGLAANIAVLSAKCGSSDEGEAIPALKTVKALAEGSPAAQIFTKDCLAACKLTETNFFLTTDFHDSILTMTTRAQVWNKPTPRVEISRPLPRKLPSLFATMLILSP